MILPQPPAPTIVTVAAVLPAAGPGRRPPRPGRSGGSAAAVGEPRAGPGPGGPPLAVPAADPPTVSRFPGQELFFSHVHLHGGPAPVRRFLPDLIDLIMRREIDPGRVFDLELPLTEAAEGYRAMDERRAIKTLLHP